MRHTPRLRIAARILATFAGTAILTGCHMPVLGSPDPSQASVTTSIAASPTTDPGSGADQGRVPPSGLAVDALAILPVKGRAPRAGYARDLFGEAWADTDQDGCNTRDQALGLALVDVTLKAGSCVVLSGTLNDPYSGTVISFVRGKDTSAAVQVDHVVPLSLSWQTGAQDWDAERRAQFANDLLNLQPTDGELNQQKGDGDAATWLPPAKTYRCAYVSRQIAVKLKWGLWVTPSERDAIARVLEACPGQELPSATPAEAVPATPSATDGGFAPSAQAAGEVAFRNCAEARAAGAAPVQAGDPGYAAWLDGDGDGTGCEVD